MANTQSTLARRVTLIGIGAVAAVLFLTSVLLSLLLMRNANRAVETWASDRGQAMEDTITAINDTARALVKRSYGSFRQEFGPQFQLNEETGELRDWGPKLNENYSAVDKFANTTGGVAQGFVRKGDDFVRITTSVKKADGGRELGGALGTHPARAAALAGQAYSAPELLQDRAFMVHYEPLKGEDGKVIGILSVGFDLDVFNNALGQMVKDIHFFDSGGVAVVQNAQDAANSRFYAHPTARGKKVADVSPALAKALAAIDPEAHQTVIDDLPEMLGHGGGGYFGVAHASKAAGVLVVAQVKRSEAMAQNWSILLPFWGLLVAATLALGFGLFWLVSRWVAQPMAKLSAAMDAVSNGDLSQSVTSSRQDEIGQLIRDTESMRAHLANTIGTVRHSVDSIGVASREIATGNQDLSQRTEQTASNLQAAAGSMEHLTGTVRQTADSARVAQQLVSDTSTAAARGGSVVGQVVQTMDEISASSRKISDIIGVIDGIAFQTNILALNAAVEAARAGEQGRGFAVVAGEVRTLAGRSAEAAKEIKTLINTSVEKVETGARLVQDAGSAMNDIVSGVQRVSDIIGDIAAASTEQSDGISQVNQSVVQLDQMTQQNAALVEESAAAAESLRDQAQRLVEAIAIFRTGTDSPGMSKGVGTSPIKAPSPSLKPPAMTKARTPAPKSTPGAGSATSPRPPSPAPTLRPAAAPKAAAPKPPPAPAARPAPPPADDDWETF
ncbi:methyl-accepting chemotaxis protein [Inhella gelatinilytica]|uniref:Cache 3/Cache 2 fusion domain-containing protein n=1 Tax=Inhella gelatinilytica TaxID=2795030 RepID=A0A931NEP3_9BURK|nr:methyl-accepting chemotaxis protein [Inhella gelatinilytica]MBH9552726.1 Cache 3/Cache 2 fusion domain-containing protein [Inhella gelatinilytica]